MFPLSIHNWFEIAALAASIIFWNKIKHTKLRWLLPFLLFIVVIELSGRYLRTELRTQNAWLYNFSIPLEHLFYAFLFSLHYNRKLYKNVALAGMIGLSIFVLVNLFFLKGYHNINTNNLRAGYFLMIVLSCFYFLDMLFSENINYIKQPMFWIATGVLLFNTGHLAYGIFSDYLVSNKLDKTRTIFKLVNNKLIWVLYTCIIIAIICSKKRK